MYIINRTVVIKMYYLIIVKVNFQGKIIFNVILVKIWNAVSKNKQTLNLQEILS